VAARRVRIRTLLGLIVALALLATGCTSSGEVGNEQAFCGLLSEGVGLRPSAQRLTDFDALEAVAPLSIRGTVLRLRNTELDLNEIDPLDVEALFNARFDPNASAARTALQDYAVTTCAIDLGEGPPVPADEVVADLREYLESNFGDAPWIDTVGLTPGISNGKLNSIIARLVAEPTTDDEAGEICRAVSVYLYTLRSGQGTVSVEKNGAVVAFRSGPEASCTSI